MSNYPATTAPPAVADVRTESSVRRGVKALVSSSSRVLLVRERHSDGGTFWTLPGGGVRPGEDPDDALRRELVEEIDCDAVPGDPVSEFWYAHRGVSPPLSVYAVIACHIVSRVRPVRAEGVLEARWVDPERVPAATLPQVRQLLRTHGP